MHVILAAITAGEGVTITADYLVEKMLKEEKLQLIWKGAVATHNTLFLVYDKTKVTSEQISLAQMLITVR